MIIYVCMNVHWSNIRLKPTEGETQQTQESFSRVTEKNLKSGSNRRIYNKRVGFEIRNISWKDVLFMGHIRMLLRVGVLLAGKVLPSVNQTPGHYALLLSWSISSVTPFVFCKTGFFQLICWHFLVSTFTLLQNILCVSYRLLYNFAFTS